MSISTYKNLDAPKAIDALIRRIPDSSPACYLSVRKRAERAIPLMASKGLSPFLIKVRTEEDENGAPDCAWIKTYFRSFPHGRLASILFFSDQDRTSSMEIVAVKAVPPGYKDTTGMTIDDLVQYTSALSPYCYGNSYLSAPLRYYKGISSAPWLKAGCHTRGLEAFERSLDRLACFLDASFDSSLDEKKLTFSAVPAVYETNILEAPPRWFVVGYTSASFIEPGNKMWIATGQLPPWDNYTGRHYIFETRSVVPIRPVPDNSYDVLVLASPCQITVKLDSDIDECTYANRPYMVSGWELEDLEQDLIAKYLIIRIIQDSLQQEDCWSLYQDCWSLYPREKEEK